jgi:hypothetical protein
MIEDYFLDYEVRPEFNKQFISLWPGWLGTENMHKLDEVTETEWSRFNQLILEIADEFKVGVVDLKTAEVSFLTDIEQALKPYAESMNSSSRDFGRYILPDLDCPLTEEWDYTYILWHKNNGALEKIEPLIKRCELKHFSY